MLFRSRYFVDQSLSVTSLNPNGKSARRSAPAVKSHSTAVEKTVLPNGLTVLTKEDSRLPLVSLFANFRGGQLSETPDTAGLGRLHSQMGPKYIGIASGM